jgi:hypothetical protein
MSMMTATVAIDFIRGGETSKKWVADGGFPGEKAKSSLF